MIGHIIERSLIHLFSAMGLVVGVFFGLQSLNRRQVCSSWMPNNIGARLLLSGLLVFLIASMREVFDLHNGQPYQKVFTDWASWIIGLGLGIWATYRLVWLNWEGE
jgi:hypothetical protein